MNKPVSRMVCLMLALALCIGMMSAVAESTEDVLTVTMYFGCSVAEFPPDGNEIEKMIEDYVGGVDFKINAYSSSVLHEMMPTMIASNDMPMVVNVGGSQLSKGYMITAMREGAFWDVTDYVKEIPNFADLSPASMTNYMVDGRLYGLPIERGISRDSVTYRYDWLQNLGLEEPETVEELVNMLIAFTTDDPDGNGENDTYGSVTNPLRMLCVMMGAPNNWKYVNGEMVKAQMTDEYKAALEVCRELYSIGAIHPEFAIRERADFEGDFKQGKGGCYFNVSTDISGFEPLMEEGAVLHSKNIFANENGDIFTAAGRGNNGTVLFSTAAIPDEETLDKVIHIFDRLADEEMCNLLVLGLENVNYTVVDGVAQPNEENISFYNEKIGPYGVCCVRWPNLRTMPTNMTYGAQRNLEIIEENAPYAVADDSMGLISEIYNDKGADLDTILDDAATLYIMGEIDMDEYEARLNNWLEQGGRDLAAEYAKLYEQRANG